MSEAHGIRVPVREHTKPDSSLRTVEGCRLTISKQVLNQLDGIEFVRLRRESRNQNLGFSSRPFIVCGLPVRRPTAGQLLFERRNGHFVLQVTGHPDYGLATASFASRSGKTESCPFSWRRSPSDN